MNPLLLRALLMLLSRRACTTVSVCALIAGEIYPDFNTLGKTIAGICITGNALPMPRRLRRERRKET